MHTLAKASLASGVVSILAKHKGYTYATSLQTVFHFVTTVAAYVWASLVPSPFTKYVITPQSCHQCYNGIPSYIVHFDDDPIARMRVYQYLVLVPSLYVKSRRSSTQNFHETRLEWCKKVEELA